jgi:capsular polysaccharide transport system permease protein
MADEMKQPGVVAFPAQSLPVADRDTGGGLRPRRRRHRMLALSFLFCVVIPAIAGTLHFALFASDRYVSGAGFAVRGMEAGNGTDFLGAVTGLASTGSTTSDSYILLDYLKSRDLVEKLEREFPLRQHYAMPAADVLSRLDPSAEIERVVDYWRRHITTSFAPTTGIVKFEIEAFTPGEAQRLAERVLFHSQALVNEISLQARRDALAHAEDEVVRAEARLKQALESIRAFREAERAIDPVGAARAQTELIAGLERQLMDVRARIAALAPSVARDAPSLRNLMRQAEALEQQIASARAGASPDAQGRSGARLSGQLASFETLETERSFAQKAYASAFSSLEKARIEAGRQQRYLAVYSAPAVPQYPLYPRRLVNSLVLLGGLCAAWGIGALIAYAVRDHMP